jgi:hypothetical protein
MRQNAWRNAIAAECTILIYQWLSRKRPGTGWGGGNSSASRKYRPLPPIARRLFENTMKDGCVVACGLFSHHHRMKNFKTSENLRRRLKETRDAIKAAGGAAYEELLQKGRERRAEFRRRHPDKIREGSRRRDKSMPYRTWLCANARFRGRKRGIEATITPTDLNWPTHCPVLGIELDYPERSGMRKRQGVQPNWPSLDRWDNTKGYIPGNVFVISFRANTLKNTGNIEEMLKVLAYLRVPPPGALLEVSAQLTS